MNCTSIVGGLFESTECNSKRSALHHPSSSPTPSLISPSTKPPPSFQKSRRRPSSPLPLPLKYKNLPTKPPTKLANRLPTSHQDHYSGERLLFSSSGISDTCVYYLRLLSFGHGGVLVCCIRRFGEDRLLDNG